MAVVTSVRCDYGEHLKRESGPYVMIGYYYGKKETLKLGNWMDMNAEAEADQRWRTLVKYNRSKITCTNHFAFEDKTEQNE